jgi:hypothetical protein
MWKSAIDRAIMTHSYLSALWFLYSSRFQFVIFSDNTHIKYFAVMFWWRCGYELLTFQNHKTTSTKLPKVKSWHAHDQHSSPIHKQHLHLHLLFLSVKWQHYKKWSPTIGQFVYLELQVQIFLEEIYFSIQVSIPNTRTDILSYSLAI